MEQCSGTCVVSQQSFRVSTQFVPQANVSARRALILLSLLHGKQGPFPVADQCVFIRGFRAKRVLFVIRIIEIGNGRPDENPPLRPRQRNDELRNTSSGDDLHIDGSSSSLHENPQRSPYQREGLRDSLSFLSHIWGSSASLDTIRPPINPQLLPYPSSTALQSNGSIYDASFMTSPTPDSLIEVLNNIPEVCLPGYDCSV